MGWQKSDNEDNYTYYSETFEYDGYGRLKYRKYDGSDYTKTIEYYYYYNENNQLKTLKVDEKLIEIIYGNGEAKGLICNGNVCFYLQSSRTILAYKIIQFG